MRAFSISRFRPSLARSAAGTSADPTNDAATENVAEKSPTLDSQVAPDEKPQQPLELPDEDAQRGVRMVEAVTLTWTKTSLIWVFVKYMDFKLLVAITDRNLACGCFTLSMPFNPQSSVI